MRPTRVSQLRDLEDHVLLAKHLQREMQKQQLGFASCILIYIYSIYIIIVIVIIINNNNNI